MADHAIVNLKQVEDQAVGFGLSPNLEARFAGVPLELTRSGISYQRLAPGFRLPWGHHHKSQEEVYVILGGSGRLKLDDEIVAVGQWDAVRIGSEVMRGLEAGPDGIELLAFGAPKVGDSVAEDVEQAPGWWAD